MKSELASSESKASELVIKKTESTKAGECMGGDGLFFVCFSIFCFKAEF